MSDQEGTLYVVSTPIGNLEDITMRALRILRESDLVAAEDTRHTRKLFSHFDIHTPLTSYHPHNQEEKTEVLLDRIHKGQSVALVCDAGTPLISDPGLHLLRRAIQEEIRTVPIPGASAVLCALSVSGLQTDAFLFEGFLPARRGRRLKKLDALRTLPYTLIFFESPYRILRTLRDCQEILGDRLMVLGREMTKIFEEMVRGKISEVISHLDQKKIKGEITFLIGRGD